MNHKSTRLTVKDTIQSRRMLTEAGITSHREQSRCNGITLSLLKSEHLLCDYRVKNMQRKIPASTCISEWRARDAMSCQIIVKHMVIQCTQQSVRRCVNMCCCLESIVKLITFCVTAQTVTDTHIAPGQGQYLNSDGNFSRCICL